MSEDNLIVLASGRPDWQTGHDVLNLSICLFVSHQTCEHDILIMNEPILMPIGTSDPWDKDVKLSPFGVRRSHKPKDRFRGLVEASFWILLVE